MPAKWKLPDHLIDLCTLSERNLKRIDEPSFKSFSRYTAHCANEQTPFGLPPYLATLIWSATQLELNAQLMEGLGGVEISESLSKSRTYHKPGQYAYDLGCSLRGQAGFDPYALSVFKTEFNELVPALTDELVAWNKKFNIL